MNIRRTNKYGASLVRCEHHMEKTMKNFFGPFLPDEFTNEPCHDCENERLDREAPEMMKRALLDPKCVHTRWRNGPCGGYVTAYHQDDSSPSGVLAACDLDEERFDIVYNMLVAEGSVRSSLSPLSPTEGIKNNLR